MYFDVQMTKSYEDTLSAANMITGMGSNPKKR